VFEEKVRIKCTKCSAVFRERGNRIRDGFQLNCPQCNKLITFDTSSEDVNVRKAFKAAKELRHFKEGQVNNAATSYPPRD
jgi:uncharacterized C2H2 Zn-finger protein